MKRHILSTKTVTPNEVFDPASQENSPAAAASASASAGDNNIEDCGSCMHRNATTSSARSILSNNNNNNNNYDEKQISTGIALSSCEEISSAGGTAATVEMYSCNEREQSEEVVNMGPYEWLDNEIKRLISSTNLQSDHPTIGENGVRVIIPSDQDRDVINNGVQKGSKSDIDDQERERERESSSIAEMCNPDPSPRNSGFDELQEEEWTVDWEDNKVLCWLWDGGNGNARNTPI